MIGYLRRKSQRRKREKGVGNRYKPILPLNTNEKVVDQFGWMPLSVIEPTKESKNKWKNAYLNDGKEELRRGKNTKYLAGLKFSEFHAGLTENILNYWSMVGSVVVDPFAGRVTRAYITNALGREYYGYDASPNTAERANRHLKENNMPSSVVLGDGCLMEETPNNFADLIMTCPPYHRLEKYESANGQLSDIKEYEVFLQKIQTCGENMERVLKPGGFLVWVCGDWRDGKEYRPFHSDCISLFKEAGLIYHDLIVVKNHSPFAALQMGKVAAKRYTSKIHEFILVFRKEGELIPPSNVIKETNFNEIVHKQTNEQGDLFTEIEVF